MEKRTSILTDLKQQCAGYLNPKLVDAWIIETAESNFLEYVIQDTHECTITYRHNLNLWGEPPVGYTAEQMLAMGYSQKELDAIEADDWGEFTLADSFIGEYVIEDTTTLAMTTELFTEKWADFKNQ